MKNRFLILILLVVVQSGHAQGFVNLDFESANLSPIPSGQYGGEVSSTDAIPGWTGFLGTSQVTQVLQNNFTLGNASIDILGPDWTGGIIEGQYTLVLQPGVDPFGSGNAVSASVSQVGSVPANAKSIQFKAYVYPAFAADFSVSFAGQNLSLLALATGTNYTLYGADISSSAGKVGTLTISTVAQPNIAPYYFDSIVFSPSSVPEPSSLALGALGALLLGFRRWRPF
jgi:hypothetical protein